MQIPSRHDHVGSMIHDDHQAYCSECGQTWYLKRGEEKNGKTFTKWIPTTRGDF